MRELEGCSYKEIGEITGIPIGTVMSTLSRARERLQRTLSAAAKQVSIYLISDTIQNVTARVDDLYTLGVR